MSKICVILAGGMGTRLMEKTNTIPKPMVKIGNQPILLHIMKIYISNGISNFLICAGYKHYYIENFFNKSKQFECLKNNSRNKYFFWKKYNTKINIVYTGKNTATGGRILKIKKFLVNFNHFFLTYGDGLSNINIKKLERTFIRKRKIGILTSIQPQPRYGFLKIDKDHNVLSFKEKFKDPNLWVNGGFFIFDKKVFKYIKNFNYSLEFDILRKLTKLKQLSTYKHFGFWDCMDTLRDKIRLDDLWKKKKAPWKLID